MLNSSKTTKPLNLASVYNNTIMQKQFTIFFLFLVCSSNAQRTMFGGNNNYVRPVIASQSAETVTNGLVLNLDASNTASYPGTGTTWTNLVTGNAVTSFTINGNVTL